MTLDRFPSALTESPWPRPEYDASRDAKLAQCRAAVEAAQRVVNDAHRSHGLNLCDVQTYLQYALEAIESEEEV